MTPPSRASVSSTDRDEQLSAISERERELLSWLQRGVIGGDAVLPSPFGPKPLRYFDYVASGRPFEPIERLIRERVLPIMANTHTEASTTGRFMGHLFDEAHRKVARHVGAGDADVVIFTGSGSTGAINHLIYALGLKLSWRLTDHPCLQHCWEQKERPVIFQSRMEHHSNDLAWRETVGDHVYVDFDARGQIDLDDLERKLAHCDRPFRIGSFTLASNVTGILTDQVAISQILHRHGALAFFDGAAAAPYIALDVNPPVPGGEMDALFISPHKFLGGPQTPGLLIAKRSLFRNTVPVQPGGGTVLWVYDGGQRYVPDLQRREESGTPPIVQVIRAGLAFDLKAIIGVDLIARREEHFLRRAIAAWRRNDNLIVLGNPELPRLGIVSVIFKDAHHNLIVRLLSDLYGIQARGGCMCAGPYGHYLLDIDAATSAQIRARLDEGHVGEKPGWVRFGFSPATREDEFEVLLEAVDHLSLHWRDYADRYRLDDATGEFFPVDGRDALPDLSLSPE